MSVTYVDMSAVARIRYDAQLTPVSDSAWSLPRTLQAGRPPCSCTWTTSPTLPALRVGSCWIVLDRVATDNKQVFRRVRVRQDRVGQYSNNSRARATAGGQSDACTRSIYMHSSAIRASGLRGPASTKKKTGLEFNRARHEKYARLQSRVRD